VLVIRKVQQREEPSNLSERMIRIRVSRTFDSCYTSTRLKLEQLQRAHGVSEAHEA
jgi:hypothetical protein